jgi:hypothetical protein
VSGANEIGGPSLCKGDGAHRHSSFTMKNEPMKAPIRFLALAGVFGISLGLLAEDSPPLDPHLEPLAIFLAVRPTGY